MWLDRRPGQHQQQPGSRSRSPLPPRSSSSSRGPYLTSQSQQRPGFAPRGSSLSLVSNDSSSSLLASAKKANGSSLRQSAAVDDALDPEEVLDRILGPLPSSSASSGAKPPGTTITEEDLDFDFDFDGLSLREIVGRNAAAEDTNQWKSQTVEDCRLLFASPSGHLHVCSY